MIICHCRTIVCMLLDDMSAWLQTTAPLRLWEAETASHESCNRFDKAVDLLHVCLLWRSRVSE